jgi:hypothetical protein
MIFQYEAETRSSRRSVQEMRQTVGINIDAWAGHMLYNSIRNEARDAWTDQRSSWELYLAAGNQAMLFSTVVLRLSTPPAVGRQDGH